jgi:DNA-binding HxlR family transcriptional regulator
MARALEVVGERWTLLILRDLFMGVHRFSDLHAHLDIPRAVLAARLAALVEQGIVERRPYRADRAEFHLTAAGRELWPIVHGLVVWGDRHRPVDGGPRRLFVHAACGTSLAGAGDCPACGITPEPAEIETRPGPGVDPARRHDRVSRALRRPHRLLTPLAVKHRS